MTLSNYHSHTTFCDGRSAPEDFVKFALSNHFTVYGFSSHSPLPFETFWNMSKTDLPEYLQEIDRLKKKYEGRIQLYASLEIDYLNETYNPSIPYFQEMPLDYRIGSVHFLPLSEQLSEKEMMCIDGDPKEFVYAVEAYYDGDIRKVVAQYYQSVYNMIKAGGMDMIGHIDKIYMNGIKNAAFSFEADWYRDPFIACLELAAEKGIMIEINTKNLTELGQTFPHHQYFPLLKELKIPVVVNSDCHYPHLVNDGRAEAFRLLKNAGFRSVRELLAGEWQDVAI